MEQSDFTEEKIEYLKSYVESKIDKAGVIDRIKFNNNDIESEEVLLQRIKESGLVEEIIDSFKHLGEEEVVDKSKRTLYLKLTKGSAFIDYENAPEDAYFTFDILFLGQRVVSKRVPAGSDFSINQSFILNLNPSNLEVNLDLEKLKKLSSPIHLVVIYHCEEKTQVVGSKSIEWRWTLCYGSWNIESELMSSESLNRLNVGVIEVLV